MSLGDGAMVLEHFAHEKQALLSELSDRTTQCEEVDHGIKHTVFPILTSIIVDVFSHACATRPFLASLADLEALRSRQGHLGRSPSAYHLACDFFSKSGVPESHALRVQPHRSARHHQAVLAGWTGHLLKKKALSTALRNVDWAELPLFVHYSPFSILCSADDREQIFVYIERLEALPLFPHHTAMSSSSYKPELPVLFAKNNASLKAIVQGGEEDLSGIGYNGGYLCVQAPPHLSRQNSESGANDDLPPRTHASSASYSSPISPVTPSSSTSSSMFAPAIPTEPLSQLPEATTSSSPANPSLSVEEATPSAERRQSASQGMPSSTPAPLFQSVVDDDSTQFRTLTVSWTPNTTMRFIAGREEEVPLPQGWDSAYDPVTGHTYYINHEEQTTTWKHPAKSMQRDPVALEMSTQTPFDVVFTLCTEDSERGYVGFFGTTQTKLAPAPTCIEKASDNGVGKDEDECSGNAQRVGSKRISSCQHPPSSNPSTPSRIHRGPSLGYDTSAELEDEQFTYRWLLQEASKHREALVVGLPTPSLCQLAEKLRRCSACVVTHTPAEWRMPVVVPGTRMAMKQRVVRRSLNIEGQYKNDWEPGHFAGYGVSRPIDDDTMQLYMSKEGRFTDYDAFKKQVFFRTVHWSTRPKAWLFLLDVVTPWSTAKQRERIIRRKKHEYLEKKTAWALTPSASSRPIHKVLKDLMKDAIRTDRTFTMFSGSHNVWLEAMIDIITTWLLSHQGRVYCQGMSDLLAPLLAVYKDEAMAYLAFDKLMDRVYPQFDSGLGMAKQLGDLRELVSYLEPRLHEYLSQADSLDMLFAYRWLLLVFKREFKVHEAMVLWDLILSHYRTRHFALFVAVAVMQVTADGLVAGDVHLPPSAHVLQYYSSITGSVDLHSVIAAARQNLYTFRCAHDKPEHLHRLIQIPAHSRTRPSVAHDLKRMVALSQASPGPLDSANGTDERAHTDAPPATETANASSSS